MLRLVSRCAILAAVAGLGLGFGGCERAEEDAGKGKAEGEAGKEPIKVGAIFAVTGGASFLGAPEARTAEMLEEKINAAGGIDGREIDIIVKDSQGNPEAAISLARQLIDEEEVVAIIGPSTSGETLAIKNICQEEKTPLISCAAAEKIVDPVASYVFKTPQKDSDAVEWIYKTMNDMGVEKIGIVTGNTGFGIAGKEQLQKYAGDYGIEIAIAEEYDKTETDLTGVLTKLKGEGVEAVVNWSIVPAQGIVAKNMKQLDFDVPLFQSHGFGNIKYVEAGGEAANGIIFPCGRLLVAEQLPDGHPQKDLLVEYKEDYEEKYDDTASTFGGHAYDAIIILQEALKKSGPDREKLRDAIEGLHGVAGTAGVFNFSAEDHNGLTPDSFAMLTVEDGKFVLYEGEEETTESEPEETKEE